MGAETITFPSSNLSFFFPPEFFPSPDFWSLSGAFGGVSSGALEALGAPLEVRNQAKPLGVVVVAVWVSFSSFLSSEFLTATAAFMTAPAVMNGARRQEQRPPP